MRAASSYARGRQHLLQAVSARASHSQSPMWAHQAKLPRFPLPALPQTLERFQGALQALLTPEEVHLLAQCRDLQPFYLFGMQDLLPPPSPPSSALPSLPSAP